MSRIRGKTCFLGIDQGSSLTKVLLVQEDGEVLFIASRKVKTFRQGNTLSQSPQGIYASVMKGLKEVLKYADENGLSISGGGIATQRSSFLYFDRSGNPLTQIISWRDVSSVKELIRFRKESSIIRDVTGLPLTPYYSATKMRRHIPGGKKEILFGTVATYLLYRLTGGRVFAIDPGNAQRTLLFDIRTLEFSPTLMDLFEIPGYVRFPEIRDTSAPFGMVKMGRWRFPIQSMNGDQQAAFIASSGWRSGWRLINLGTGGFMLHPVGPSPKDGDGLIITLSHAMKGKAFLMMEGTVNAVGDALNFFEGLSGKFRPDSELPGKNLPVSVYGLQGTGAPLWDEEFPASTSGMGPGTRRVDLLWSTLFGALSFFRLIHEKINLCGGEAPSQVISGGLSHIIGVGEFLRDLTGVDTYISKAGDLTGIGAALTGTGLDPSRDIIIRKRSLSKVRGRGYVEAEKYFQRWKKLYEYAKTCQLDGVISNGSRGRG
jgi:glycerol kinase